MFAAILKLALAAALLVLFAPGAEAQRGQRCAKAKDQVKCMCFFANNGHIVARPGGGRRAVIQNMGDVDRYLACMRRSGRPNG
jgi:hypothetical protein